jgi:hypothetical protein
MMPTTAVATRCLPFGCTADAADQAQPENVTSGFVETYGVGVCRGRYAALLLREWHRWDEQFGSENDPVDIFGDEQLFVVSFRCCG